MCLILKAWLSLTSEKFSRHGGNSVRDFFQEVPCLTNFRSDMERAQRKNVN